MTPPPRQRPSTGRGGLRVAQKALLVVAAITIPVIVWAGVRIASRDEEPRLEELAAEPGVSHVHGLGLNPSDGSLIVATHYGSFRISADGDEATRIGDSYQDTMGFTVVGPDHFLGSGHPDAAGSRAGQPSRLGLIESTDAGETWRPLSLGDEVDFHALAFAHDQTYGWDAGSGQFMVSSNGRDWETGARLDLFGFAIDPEDPDHIVGAGPDGLVESTDRGRTWTRSDGPQLVTLSWDAEAGLWGADPSGNVWFRGSEAWNDAGRSPGMPQAFLATADALFIAVHDEDSVTGIYRSTDDGRSWDLRYRDAQQ